MCDRCQRYRSAIEVSDLSMSQARRLIDAFPFCKPKMKSIILEEVTEEIKLKRIQRVLYKVLSRREQ